jgi:uncharacterized protein (DUF58 family)
MTSLDTATPTTPRATRLTRSRDQRMIAGVCGGIAEYFGWEPALRRLTARHDVILVEIVDPRELELPAVGHVTIVDPETDRQHEADTSDPRLRAAYAEAMTTLREHNAQAVHAAGADHLRMSTDDDWARMLVRLLRRRARHPRPARSRTSTATH